jgi:hypothetical protein
MTKKPKPAFSGFQNDIDESEITLQTQANPRLPTVVNYKGKRYRLFSLEGLSPELGQQWILHYLYLLTVVKIDKFRWRNQLFYEIKPHECRLECIDSGGHWIGTGPIENRTWVWGPRTTK